MTPPAVVRVETVVCVIVAAWVIVMTWVMVAVEDLPVEGAVEPWFEPLVNTGAGYAASHSPCWWKRPSS